MAVAPLVKAPARSRNSTIYAPIHRTSNLLAGDDAQGVKPRSRPIWPCDCMIGDSARPTIIPSDFAGSPHIASYTETYLRIPPQDANGPDQPSPPTAASTNTAARLIGCPAARPYLVLATQQQQRCWWNRCARQAVPGNLGVLPIPANRMALAPKWFCRGRR